MVKRIILIVAGVVLAGGLVFGWLMLTREKLDYAGASAYVGDMLAAEDTIMDFLNAEIDGLDEREESVLASFIETVGWIMEYYRSLGASSALKNKTVKAKYDELSDVMQSLKEVQEVARWLKEFLDMLSEKDYAEAVRKAQAQAPNPFAIEMAIDMAEYLEKVEGFKEKYADGKADNYNAMTEEYGIIMMEGEALKQKYKEVTLMDVAGVSVEDVSGWFGKLKELRDILEEKK